MNNQRTHNCGQLTLSDVSKQVCLSGWVHRRRDMGGLIFIDLRDRFGLTQLKIDPKNSPDIIEVASKLRHEWVISVRGIVIERSAPNPKMPTGHIEIQVEHITILSAAKTPPFSISDEEEGSEELRLKYRYLDIRRGSILEKLVLRHKTMQTTRNFLSHHQFLEVTTPILAKSTPEGARDYLVPSRIYPGNFYALPQSPQIFKQLLMISGLDRYFQIATCFRDEDLRADRQPEFSQIDIEISFATPEILMNLIEGLMGAIFKECIDRHIPEKFPHMLYPECIEHYGTDRPDLRFGMPLVRVDEIIKRSQAQTLLQPLSEGGCAKALCVKGGQDISRKQIDTYTEFVLGLGLKGLAWMKYQEEGLSSGLVKFFPEALQQELIDSLKMEKGDLIFIASGKETHVNQSLDHLRRKLAKDRGLIDPDHLSFLWVTDFPLLKWNEEEERLESEHHPFTSPHFEDIPLLEKDPLKARALAYDLVLNGYEIGGGSQRIHDPNLQETLFRTLKLTAEDIEQKFGFFVQALKYGTPPHLGIALGLDRIVMILGKTENIRDVIAFPKTKKASDLMMQCPSLVHSQQLKELGIQAQDPLNIPWI